ncbi:ABC transporter transmembrane domain-containing protein [Ferrovibrio sp.]|uniref:ABC transporter ATP-binding protein n=1 Tax=Ferrovibrio sp. TaxID=1917215 RepID=UPI0025C12967|nr:ABC transporter transmembrane domain-containing protein [Ferrovibrio sp.]
MSDALLPIAAASDRPAGSGWLIRRLLAEHVRPHLGTLLLAAFSMGVVAAATAGNAWLLKPILDGLFGRGNPDWLYAIPAMVVGVAVIKGIFGYLESSTMGGFGERIIADTQIRMYSKLMHADLAWLHRVHSGRLIASFLYDAQLLREAVGKALTGMVKDSLSLLFLAIVMFMQYWELSLVVCVVFPLVAIFSRRLGRKTRKGSKRSQEETGRLTTILSETFEGARLVKAYGMEERETDRARRSVEDRLEHVMKVIRARAAASPSTEALGGIAIGIVAFIGGQQIIAGTTTPGTLGSFIAAVLMAYQPLKSLSTMNVSLQEGLAAAERVFAVLDQPATIVDAPDAKPLQVSRGEIALRHVHFAYDPQHPALVDIDLVVPAGCKAALVGASGAGKSTLLNLIPRFYDADQGSVCIDNQDVKSVTIASLRRSIALVSQELTLFDDTVRANIAYGRAGADEAAIEAAAKAAAADDFIRALPQGYDTRVGENGVKLSGGQRQRIAIARAMLRDAPILLLDEATSALDSESEKLIQQALAKLMQGRTSLVIAHRLSTVMDADIVFVLDKGKLIEQGSPAELLRQGGVFARLHATQFASQG